MAPGRISIMTASDERPLEQQWAAFAKERYQQAKLKAEEALKLAK